MRRDHKYPCEHDQAYEVGPTLPFWLCSLDECPGGRKIVVNYEAADMMLGRYMTIGLTHGDLPEKTPGTHIVDAAIEEKT